MPEIFTVHKNSYIPAIYQIPILISSIKFAVGYNALSGSGK